MPTLLAYDICELERRLRVVEPAVRLIPERHVRKVLHLLQDAGDERVLNPQLPLWVAAKFLRRNDALPAETLAGCDGDVLLLSPPDDRHLGRADDATVLRHYQRLLFRAAVQREVANRGLPTVEFIRRLASLPPEFVEEVRFVLESDHVVRHGAPVEDLFPAFVSVFAELVQFDPGRVADVFPSTPPADDVLAVIGDGIDVRSAADRCRLGGPDTDPVQEPTRIEALPTVDASDESAESDRLARLGNYARAAIRRYRAARSAAGAEKRRLEAAAQSAVRNGLMKGVSRVLGLDEAQTEEWFRSVWPLVGAATGGVWPFAAKALYDLQKLAADLRDRQFAVAPVEWLLSLGRYPVRRPLDRARDVILHTHLARVERHVLRAEVSDADRDRLLDLLHGEMAAAEGRIRRDLGPVIVRVFDEVGLLPTNLPERVARDKLVAELLDRVCERGFLRISDLRDAVARNQLKLADLAGLGEFARGDALLRADARLADELFGVYHRGEIYLRGLQRFSGLFFGTPLGRAITLYLALPFGGAFLTLMFLEELRHIGGAAAAFVSKAIAAPPAAEPDEVSDIVGKAVSSSGVEAHHHSWLIAWPTVLGFGVFLLLVLHAPSFRRRFVASVKAVWRVIRYVFWDGPNAILASPVVRALWRNRVARWVGRYFSAALVVTTLVVLVMAAFGATPSLILRWAAVVFAAVALLSNTAFGRRLADQFAEASSDAWRVLRVNLLPGLVGWFLWVFRELLGAIDHLLYTVDEKLRYREGASRPSVAVKVVLALVWFPIAYVVRFAFYLLIEPQVNPIKHFPVVTVSHKVIAPLFPTVARVLNVSEPTAALILAGVPGVFGFIAWELLANWRLYGANRPPTLTAVPIGHHGETGRGLLRPGFHSGAIPKLYRKLRAGWLGGHVPRGDRPAKVHHELHHIEAAFRRLCERAVFPLLAGTGPTAGLRPEVIDVHLGCRHMTISIGLEGHETVRPVKLVCMSRDDGEVGEIREWGWAAELSEDQRGVVRTGLEGFLVLAAGRPPETVPWDEWVEFWSKRAA